MINGCYEFITHKPRHFYFITFVGDRSLHQHQTNQEFEAYQSDLHSEYL